MYSLVLTHTHSCHFWTIYGCFRSIKAVLGSYSLLPISRFAIFLGQFLGPFRPIQNDTHPLVLTYTHSYSLILTLTHSYSLILTHTHSNSLVLTHTHSYSLLIILRIFIILDNFGMLKLKPALIVQKWFKIWKMARVSMSLKRPKSTLKTCLNCPKMIWNLKIGKSEYEPKTA